MFALARSDFLQLSILLLALPLQYWLITRTSTDSTVRPLVVTRTIARLKEFAHDWFRLESWQEWCEDVLQNILDPFPTNEDNSANESPALEVLRLRSRNKDGYYASSAEIRKRRPRSVRLSIGQVVRHTRFKYKGVIIGWDKEAKAPEPWLQKMHFDNAEGRHQPHYLILVDTQDRGLPQHVYVPQDHLQILESTKVFHPKLADHFSHFDGQRYIPRAWLKYFYPKD